MKINFTDEQKEAIAYPKSMVLTACPGSGKTAVIVEKIVIDLGPCKDYQGVIAISYTNKASEELKRRCVKNVTSTKSSFFGTIDKFYLNEIVFQYIHQIWGRVENLKLIKFSDLPPESKERLAIYNDIEDVCAKIDVYDFVELKIIYDKGFVILEFIPLLAYFVLVKSSSSRRYLSTKYKSVYIDEYQDAGFIQHLIFILLSTIGIKSVAVGDIDQSIYSYAGKSSRYLTALLSKDSGFEPFEITINHRSHPSIINYASRLLNEKAELIPCEDIRVFRTTVNGTQRDISAWIDAEIFNVLKFYNVKKESKVAILLATNTSVSLVSSFVKTKCRAYLDDELSKVGGAASILLKSLLTFRYNKSATAQSIIDELSHKSIESNALRSMRRVIKEVRLVDDLELIPSLRKAVKMLIDEDLSAQHIDAISSITGNRMMLNNYLPISDDELQIMTLHKAKGLEFDIVFHLDLYDWILPRREFIKGCYDEVFSNYEQCLNLHYVGITRAKKAIMLVNSTQRFNFQKEVKQAKSSQFLSRKGLGGLYKVIK